MNTEPGLLLIVDDNETNRDLLSRRLRRQGHKVILAEGGPQALELIAQNNFDMVLLDIEMPDVSGLEVLKTLRKRYAPIQLPVIMVTAKNHSDEIVKALSLGANDYLTKPIDFPVAFARIQNQLSHKRAEEALRESEERYALAALGANDGLWDWNLKTSEVYFSPRWKSMLGCEESEVGNSVEEWFKRVHPEDLDRVRAAIAVHLMGRTAHFESEHRMLHRNGSYRWMLSRGLAVRHSSGKATRMAGSQTDITEGKVSDPLTGLPNRLLFMDRLERSIKRSKRREDYQFALFFLDLDRFKVINDSLGHLIGDQMLIAIARRLESCLRSTDGFWRFEQKHIVARLGGDEFTILVDDIKHVRDVIRIAERLLEKMSMPFDLKGHEVFATVSIGIAFSETGYESPAELLRDADTAMYRAKALGKARYELFDPAMRDQAVARMNLETDLRRAIEREEFLVHYQPIVSLNTGSIVGFEALARWQHPDRGLVFPADFISVAEETEMILPIGNYVLRKACSQMNTWQAQFSPEPPWIISVNLSGRLFMQSNLVSQIEQILQESGLDARSLKLEITESMIMENTEFLTAMLIQMKELGIQLALDDFGTGYSSLSYLHQFPLDTLKVDRSFVGRMGPKGENSEIVRTIVALAHNLDLDVTAEGVETGAQLALLQSMGCEYAQGSYFSMPLDAQAAGDLLVAAPHQ